MLRRTVDAGKSSQSIWEKMKAHELLARENGAYQGWISVFQAMHKSYKSDRAFKAACRKIAIKVGPIESPMDWAMNPTRTQAEVVALLKELDI